MAKTGPKGSWKYKKNFHPKDFIEKSRKGKNITQIVRDWDITRDTIYKWAAKYPELSDAIKKGKEYCEAWYTDIGQSAITGQASVNGKAIKIDLGFFVWMTKNVCKWSDKIEEKTKIQQVEKQVIQVRWADENDTANALPDTAAEKNQPIN